MNWYSRVSSNLGVIPDFISYFETELTQAKKEVSIYGSVEKNLSALPGITEQRFNQLQEIEAVLNYLNIQLRQLKKKHFQNYLERYNRELSSRDADRYADGEQEVIDFEVLINEVALLRNRFLGIMKGLESKNFMLGHITRLRTSGLEDASI